MSLRHESVLFEKVRSKEQHLQAKTRPPTFRPTQLSLATSSLQYLDYLNSGNAMHNPFDYRNEQHKLAN